MFMPTQFPMLLVFNNLHINTPFPFTGNNFIVLLWSLCTLNIVLYSNYNICGRYLIIVLVRDINHVYSYSYSFLKVTPVLLVSYSYDQIKGPEHY